MLTNEQMNDSRRHHTTADFFADNAAVFAAFAPLVTEVSKHAANVGLLDALVPLKDVVTRGTTLDKNAQKHAVSVTAGIICDKGRAFGLSFNHLTLAEELKTRIDLIEHRNDEDLLPFIQHVKDLLTPFIADVNFIPYGVTAADLTALVAAATSFDGMIGQATTASSTATVANIDIDALLDGPLRQNLVQFDLLVNHFKITNPDFVNGYHINSAVENLGVHHSGIEGTVVGPTPPDNPAATPKSGVTIKILGTNKIAQTNVLGQYSIVRVRNGNYNIEVSATGYRTVSKIVEIKRGRITTEDITLVPA